MMRFGAQMPDGRLVFGIGLSRENCRRLLDGKPIAFPLEEMGGKGEILIMGGETEQAMMRQLQEFIGPDTKVSIDPRFKT